MSTRVSTLAASMTTPTGARHIGPAGIVCPARVDHNEPGGAKMTGDVGIDGDAEVKLDPSSGSPNGA